MFFKSPALPAEPYVNIGTANTPADTQEKLRIPPAGQSVYSNETYRFSFFYPDGYVVKEYDEGGGALTLTIQSVALSQGFQIFIVPYQEPQISEERFRKDVPSGVREEPKEFLLDGELATAFFSKNDYLGDTREVWFLHDGYLFEVTAPRAADIWLDTILQAWKFI